MFAVDSGYRAGRPGSWCAGLCVAATLGAGTAGAAGLDPLKGAIGETRFIADARLRSESVDQEPIAENAHALTLRARLGFETGKAWGTALLVEGDGIVPLIEHYNSSTNGKTTYPVVADPEGYEFNRLQLTNTSITDTTITLGRQRIVLDDHRFVGNVGWRQNEQTFDGLRVVNKHIAKTTIDVSYINQVNRIWGPKGLPGGNDGRFKGDIVLANVGYQFDSGKLTGFGYFLDFDASTGPLTEDSRTLGLRFAGEKPLAKIKVAYTLSWANQRDSGRNPLDFSNNYWFAGVSGTYRMFSFGGGYEVLQGDGTKGFSTPLATLHKFEGWADKFLGTPVNGLEDKYLEAGLQKKGVGPLETLGLTMSWHDFDSGRMSINYGHELDVQLQGKYRRFTGIVKYADYNAAASTPMVTDTSKLWVEVGYTWQ
jgi:hypothetical protein